MDLNFRLKISSTYRFVFYFCIHARVRDNVICGRNLNGWGVLELTLDFHKFFRQVSLQTSPCIESTLYTPNTWGSEVKTAKKVEFVEIQREL